MAIGKASDFSIQQDEFQTGLSERLAQNVALVNEGSGGAISLRTANHKGDYSTGAFFSSISGLVTRRDTTSVSAATDLAMTQGDHVAVKVKRTIGPVAQTLDSFRSIMARMSNSSAIVNPASLFSMVLGQQVGTAIASDYVNNAIRALYAAIGGTAAITHDYSGTGDITHGQLAVAFGKMGDRSGRISTVVAHSKVATDLLGQAMTDKITNVADVAIMTGTTAALGRRLIISDSAPLFNATPTPDEYHTLCLVPGAVEIEQSEEPTDIVVEVVTGLDNLVVRYQGEFAYTLKIKGFSWDITNGGANPNDTAVALATNWDQDCTDLKDGPGAVLITQ